ncbi:MAG: hypothetical protein AAGN82_07740 [Myxococcota bacterium]
MFWSSAAVLAYVVALGLDGGEGWPQTVLGGVLALAWLGLGFATVRAPRVGAPQISETGRRAARGAISGSAVAVAAALGPELEALAAFEYLGAGVCVVGSLVALSRLVSPASVVVPAEPRPRDEAAIVAGLVWSFAVVAAVAPRRFGDGGASYAAVAAGLSSLGVTLIGAIRVYARRRHAWGVAERTAAAGGFAALGIAVSILATLMRVGAPEDVVPRVALAVALGVTGSAVGDDAARVSLVLRRLIAATVLGAPVVSAAVFLAYKEPSHAGLVLFAAVAAAVGVGLLAPRLAGWLAPERGAWVRTLVAAIEATQRADPRRAVVEVLSLIRRRLHPEAKAMIHRFASQDRVFVDRAGYLHVASAAFPLPLVDLVAEEPLRVVTTEGLRAAQVRQPQLRPMVTWLDQHDIGFVALVLDDDVPVGALLWPHAGRVSPLSVEEVQLARRLADHLGRVTGAASELARSRQREMRAVADRNEAQRGLAQLQETLARRRERPRGLPEILARSLSEASYSPATAAARVDVELAVRAHAAVRLVAAPGIDALGWAAVAHLASAHGGDGALIWIEGGHAAEHAIERWAEHAAADRPDLPLAAARGGTLVLFDPHALPADVQMHLGQVGFQRTNVVYVLPNEAPSGLHPRLAARLDEAPLVTLPPLAARPEDIRAQARHELARLGRHIRGRPFGLDLSAERVLLEHDWPGNDLEFRAVLLRATEGFEGDVIDVASMTAAIGVGRYPPPRLVAGG